MILTDDDELAATVRMLRNNGANSAKQHVAIGLNYNLTDIQAAMGIIQIGRLSRIVEQRRSIAGWYSETLQSTGRILLPWENEERRHNYTFYSVRTPGMDGPSIVNAMKQRGVEVKNHNPVHLEPIYAKKFGTGPGLLPNTEQVASDLISLPSHNKLTRKEVAYISENLIDIVNHRP